MLQSVHDFAGSLAPTDRSVPAILERFAALQYPSFVSDELPAGWSVEGVRPHVSLVPHETYVVEDCVDDRVELTPTAILSVVSTLSVTGITAPGTLGRWTQSVRSSAGGSCGKDLETTIRGL